MKFFQANYKSLLILFSTFILVVLISSFSLIYGEYPISPHQTWLVLWGEGTENNISIIQNIRLPRILSGLAIGSSLALSGLLCTTALKKPLADSGILGIQSGATSVVLLIILVFPTFTVFLPLIAFLGGLLAFSLILLVSYNGTIKPMRLILGGVAINAFFSAIIGILTIFNPQKLQNALSWLNGSLVSVSVDEMHIILLYTSLSTLGTLAFIPTLKLLALDDAIIASLGKNPNFYRFIVLVYSVLLAVISVAYVGIVSFVGIIIPKASKALIGSNLIFIVLETILLGGLLIITTDFVQKLIFSPMEIPVGIIVGLVGTPVFLILLRRQT